MKSFKSIGIEVELFLTNGAERPHLIVYNAQKRMEQLLGFNINAQPNSNDDINRNNYLRVSQWGDIRFTTDGTPVEFGGYIDNLFPALFHQFIEYFNLTIGLVEKGLLREYKFDWAAYRQSDDSKAGFASFANPGCIYASERTVYNAITGEVLKQDKKEGNQLVTQRSAGLHLHLELNKGIDPNNRVFANMVVNKLNQLFDQYYAHYAGLDAFRREKLQNKDIYRIKKHENGVVTLEFRRLTPIMLKNGGLFPFICAADEAIASL